MVEIQQEKKTRAKKTLFPQAEYLNKRVTTSAAERFKKVLEDSRAFQRFTEILRQTKNQHVFLKAYEMATDRAYGKPIQYNENTNRDESGYMSTEALVDTIRTLREEIAKLKEESK